MPKTIDRREFLKLASLLPVSSSISRLERLVKQGNQLQGKPKNVIVIVFDAFSAYDISMYGYARETTPNITRLAKRAVVYHNHFAGGSFTSPGTASLLTGVLPWSHRAFRPNSKVAQPFVTRNIFSAFPNHHRMAYTHNSWADTLLRQFHENIEDLIPREQLLLDSYDKLIQGLFRNDDDIASVSWLRGMHLGEEGHAYSLFLSHLYQAYQEKRNSKLRTLFPRGAPTSGTDEFILETATETAGQKMIESPQPFLAYFHFLPPHEPYHTVHEFFNSFKGDGVKTLQKPTDIFANYGGKTSQADWRRQYDEFILYCDKEFGKLYDRLESAGLLENSWLVLTSDHGEMNERGIKGHMTDALYQPVVRVPLMIFEPGRQTGMDIHERTSAIDVLPTLAYLAGEKNPDWTEGIILPPYSAADQFSNRDLYVIRANHNDQFAAFTIASTIMVKENYKLHYYFGYPEVPAEGLVRLFDIQSDPEEMVELSTSRQGIASELLHELQVKLDEVNAPYR